MILKKVNKNITNTFPETKKMKKSQLKKIIREEFEKGYSITNDPNVEFDVDRNHEDDGKYCT